MNEKKIRNPFGKKGKEDHQNFIRQLFSLLFKKYRKVVIEDKIEIEYGKYRYSDITAYDDYDNRAEINQVGRINKNGTPVARERKAIDDIEKATGKKVIFHPLLIIFIILLFIYFVI